ncbi:hypothetical protein [Marinivivus vitaminiproducens]|uniref:hypothetical protein n=1 Tax=Marinivivus vitaminiproducens TaxID=3035935 RepID=UPI0027A6289A|nr:hypothetical protein P4R82_08565 [Geminicoccaceae bacterium SCSIO 64248]
MLNFIFALVFGALTLMGLGSWFGWLQGVTQIETPVRLMPDLRSRITWARGKGPILVEVAGTPFAGLGEAAVAKRVLDLLDGVPAGLAITWTGDPAEAGDPAYRLRLVFNPQGGDSAAVCGETAGGVAADGGVRLLAGFCESGRTLIFTRGRLGRVTGPDDRRFAELVRLTARGLMAMN